MSVLATLGAHDKDIKVRAHYGDALVLVAAFVSAFILVLAYITRFVA